MAEMDLVVDWPRGDYALGAEFPVWHGREVIGVARIAAVEPIERGSRVTLELPRAALDLLELDHLPTT